MNTVNPNRLKTLHYKSLNDTQYHKSDIQPTCDATNTTFTILDISEPKLRGLSITFPTPKWNPSNGHQLIKRDQFH